MSITDWRSKIKDYEGELFVSLMIIVVGFLGFGIGRLSAVYGNREPIKLEITPAAAALASAGASPSGNISPPLSMTAKEGESRQESSPPPLIAASGQLVASKKGTKYHFPWCAGAKSIKEENKVWFNSIEDARQAGYTPAGNCKGLK